MPKFSVIIPAYNAEATLGETLDSLIGQTFTDWHAVILDDASTDGTVALGEAFAAKDERISVVALGKSGPSRARNIGAAQFARADWLAFLDADDIFVPGKLARLAALTSGADAADAFYGRVAFFRGTPQSAKTVSKVRAEALTPFDLLCENPVCTLSNLVVRTSIFRDIGGFDPKVVHGEDVEMMIRMAAAGGRIEGVDETLVYYRASDGGLSADLQAMRAGWQAAANTVGALGVAIAPRALAQAEAIHLRYLARRALRVRTGRFTALKLAARAVRLSPPAFFSDPRRGALVLMAACAEPFLPAAARRLAFNH
ncbi:glycosyltransferase [Acuticoccus sp. MNP-M23]|uniref:glycosyltransferase family 2 protein n=1 Tax=Acuticoccus sp. MNP-M23 TaxID=3072793 RepID=UPI002814D7FA|nr:glycosyltransferase [Acuticoccus sp. MNP-M23]WMS42792.1 glycosyltransferase [Acuticoccus sp. MNP-M23]